MSKQFCLLLVGLSLHLMVSDAAAQRWRRNRCVRCTPCCNHQRQCQGHASQAPVIGETVISETVVASEPVVVNSPTAVVQASATSVESYEQPGYDMLAIVNQKRSQRGLYPLNFDPQLTATAQYKSQNRANRRITGHDGTRMRGARTEGVGYASGRSNLRGRFQTCHLYTTSYRNAGAAIAFDSSGRAYYTLLLR